MTYKLYEHQAKDIEKIRAEYKAGAQAVLHVAPTGYGKTVVFCHMVESAYNKSKSVLILTHRNNLLQQTSEKLKENGLMHGIIAAGYPSIRYRIQVASIQTLIRRLNNWEHFDFIIADEAHHMGAKSWQKIRNHFCKSKLYGCTATPLRLDNYGLGNDFDVMVKGANYKYLISKGFLSEPVYYVPDHIDFNNIKKTAGDYNKKQLAEKFQNDRYIIGNAVEFYSKLAEYKPAMVFCININEAEKTAKEFNKAGYKTKAIHSKMNYRDVRQAILELRDGNIYVVTSCDKINEGTDVPRIEAIIQCRPTLSLTINHQQHGRGLRPYPGKTQSIHIDQVGNCEKHGFIDDFIDWKLTKGKFEPPVRPVKICEYCYAAYPGYMKKCPQCGKEYAVKRHREGPELREGDLKKIDWKERNIEIENSKELNELKALALKYNYSETWAYHMWQQKRKETA